MKLPKGVTVYHMGRKYKGEAPALVVDGLKKSTQEKIGGKKPEVKKPVDSKK